MGRDTDFDFGANAPDVDARGDLVMCMGRIKCAHCGRVYGVCSEVEANLTQEENSTMLGSRGTAPGGRPQQQRSGYTYVTERDLSSSKEIARVIAVKENTTEVKEGQRKYSDVIVKIAFKGETRLFGLKYETPNWEILKESFTQDENKWIDREFYLFNETEEFSGRVFPRVEAIEKKSGKK